MSRFCTRCGTSNNDQARYCIQCGAPLASGVPAAPDAAPSESTGSHLPPTPEATPAAPASQRADLASTPAQPEPAAHDQPPDEAELARQRAQEQAAAAAAAARREHERLAATARLEQEIRARGQAAGSPREATAARQGGNGAGGLPSKLQPVKGSNAFLAGGVATGVIALLLIGGGSLWWSSQHRPQSAASLLPPGGAASMASAAASAPATPAVAMPAARPAVASAAAAVASAPAAETIVKPEKPLVSPPVVQARPQGRGQPETFAPVAKPHRPSPSAPPTAAPTTRATQSVTQVAPSSPQPAAATAPSQAPEPAASAMPRPNGRVEALRAALAACKDKGNFFSQQLCIQEMRWKYCGAPLSADPLWGKVAECPNSTQQSNNP